MFNPAERTAPARNGGEPAAFRRARYGPLIEHHRLAGAPPVYEARGDATVRPADILTDGEVEVMPAELERHARIRVPALRETRVHIDVCLASNALEQRSEGEMAAKVYQQFHRFRDFQQIPPGHTGTFATAAA